MRLQCHCIIHYMRRDGGWAACLPPYFPYINAHSATAHIATAHSATDLVERSQRQHNRINNRIHAHIATAHSATGHSATDLAGVLTAPQLTAPQLIAPHICCGAARSTPDTKTTINKYIDSPKDGYDPVNTRRYEVEVAKTVRCHSRVRRSISGGKVTNCRRMINDY
ncbi:hypothetical protein J6590_003137 [Homalodisca vitripennis]|nr:hypothetical protein J6590_003137 [Homalodisca vitripennis]